MKALAKTESGHGHISLVEVPEPAPDPDEVLIEVATAGVCGSDLGIYQYEQAYHFMNLPRVLGHEYAGEVIEVGAQVTGLEPGDRVVERPIRGCGKCYQCRTGKPHLCVDSTSPGVHEQGAFAPLITAPSDSLISIPESITFREAVIAEPASVAVRAVTQHSRVSTGASVLVQGPGPIGLLTAIIADQQGGDIVISGVEPDASYRLPNADSFGFETVNASNKSVAHRGPDRGFDVVFDATGHPSGIQTAAETVRKGGQVLIIGQTGRAEVDVSSFVRGEVELQCTYSSTFREIERVLSLIQRGRIDPDEIIDRWAGLDEAEVVFGEMADCNLCKPVFDLNH